MNFEQSKVWIVWSLRNRRSGAAAGAREAARRGQWFFAIAKLSCAARNEMGLFAIAILAGYAAAPLLTIEGENPMRQRQPACPMTLLERSAVARRRQRDQAISFKGILRASLL